MIQDHDTPHEGPTEIETLCMSCRRNGVTRLLLTKIPFFKEVIIASFECPFCGYKNRDTQTGAALDELGAQYVLAVSKPEDLNRQIIKSDACCAHIPELEFEIPAKTQKGACTTLQGILLDAADGLNLDQHYRATVDPIVATKIQHVINTLRAFAEGSELPFTFILDDPSGNSFIQFEGLAPEHDASIQVLRYPRTLEQLHAMGFYEEGAEVDPKTPSTAVSGGVLSSSQIPSTASPILTPAPAASRRIGDRGGGMELSSTHLPNQLKANGWDFGASVEENVATLKKAKEHRDALTGDNVEEEVGEGIVFHVTCPNCGQDERNEMCEIDIPGFRRCLIMAFNCLHCGSRSNEVKAMGAYGELAKRWTLKVETVEDLNRDILKSDTASVLIPELEFEMCMGTLGGLFTTVEGLLMKVVERLESTADFFSGDSADLQQKKLFQILIQRLNAYATETSAFPFTLILDDPADLSMISDRYPEHRVLQTLSKDCRKPEDGSAAADTNLAVESYKRTPEQEDELGITGMKVEDY